MNLKALESRIAAVRLAADQHMGEADADNLEITMLTVAEERHHTSGMSIDLQFGDENLTADVVIY